MNQPPDRSSRHKRKARDPRRSLLRAVRRAVFPALFMPFTLATLGASLTGVGMPFRFAWPLAGLTLVVNVGSWLWVVVLWRALPGRRDDDEQGWRRWRGPDTPPDPSGDGGGIAFDWGRFEQQFWAYVRETERLREQVLVGARARLAAIATCRQTIAAEPISG